MNFIQFDAHLDNVVGTHDTLHFHRWPIHRHAVHNPVLLLKCWICDNHLQHESVKLSFGQWVGALLLDGVLGSQYKKWLIKLITIISNRHLLFLHRLKQCTLHLRGRSVNFIS